MSRKIIFTTGLFGVAGTTAFVGTASSTIFPRKCWYDLDGKFWEEIEEIISRNKDKDREKVNEEKIQELRKVIERNCRKGFESLKEEFNEKFDDKLSYPALLVEVARKILDIKNKLDGTQTQDF